jgi:hypothetical protein
MRSEGLWEQQGKVLRSARSGEAQKRTTDKSLLEGYARCCQQRTVPPPPHSFESVETGGTTLGPYADISGEHYEGRTDCRKPASFAVALYWGIGSSSLNALVNAFDRLHMVRAWNSSCTG